MTGRTAALAVLAALMTTPLAQAAAPTPAIDPYLKLPADGSPVVGRSISVETGVWGGAPHTLAAVWQRCDARTDRCEDVGSGVGYVPGATDSGFRLRCVVTAVNSHGQTRITTAASGLVAAPLPASAAFPGVAAQQTVIPDRRIVRGGFGGVAVLTGRVVGGADVVPSAVVRAVDPRGRVRAATAAAANGRFRLRIPLVVAGRWHLRSEAAAAPVAVVVHPRIRLVRATRGVRAPGVVGLRGRIVPAVRGKLVQLQYLAPGRGWRVWRQVATGPGGRFSVHRVLAPNPSVPRFTLRIRAAIPKDVGWPYPSTPSRAIAVRVR